MSSAGGTVVGGAPQHYFCYQCDRTVTVTPSPNADLLCPTCNGGFLEEYENPNPSSNPNPYPNNDPFSAFSDPLSSFLSGLPLLFSSSSSSTGDLQNPRNLSNIFGPSGTTQTRSYAQEADPFDPFVFLQNYLSTLRDGGTNIQFVVENHLSDPGFRLPAANIGDYFIGPGLEQLIQHLAENDPNRYGTPPASKSAVEALPSIKADDQLLSSDLAQCAVCKDDFERGMEVKQMPCKHVYHSDCILPWLELHNSCPLCRYELPTDNPDYENRSRGTAGSGNLNAGSGSSGGLGGSQGSSQGQRTVERRFRISLPWPFGDLGSPAETSDGGLGNNSGNFGGSNSGDQQNRDFGSDRQDLN
uniref:RING-type E3 ubiquitin transferase n=1 Tax=Davidia involucrata TaxID=16924 RepID=A0A5B7BRV4_DAVIN